MKQGMIARKKHLLLTKLLGNILMVLIVTSSRGYGETSQLDPAGVEIELRGGKLTAAITSAPLRKVMKEFSRSTGVKVLWQGREAERMVGVRFTGLFPDDAVRRILHSENYVLFYTSTKGREKLEKILIIPHEGGRKAPLEIPKTVQEPKLLAMVERAEELEEWYEMEPVPFDQHEMIEALQEELILRGEMDALENLMQALDRDGNFEIFQ